MIVPLRKFLFIGARDDLDTFFDRAQEKGFLEFISITGKKVELPGSVHTLTAAMKVLRKLPVKPPYLGGGDVSFALQVSEHILELKSRVDKYYEQKRFLEAEISRVAPFGDFSMDDIHYIERVGNKKIQFFCIKTAKSHKTNFTDEVFYVGTDYDLDYFITINPQSRSYPGMIEMKVEYSAPELRSQLSILEEQLHQTEVELKSYAGYLDFLHGSFIEELNDYELRCAKLEASFPMDRAVFAIEAWVPENKINLIFSIIDGMAIHCEQILIESQDRVPTCMQNEGVNRIGEDLVRIYDVPAPEDKDPSGWVFWSFLVFFAMIVADGGYGFIFLALAVFMKFKFPKLKSSAKRLLKLFICLSVSCILWGVISASYFGLEISPSNPISKYSLFHYLEAKKAQYHFEQKDDVYKHWKEQFPALANVENGSEFMLQAQTVKDKTVSYEMMDQFYQNIVMELSLLFGVIHLTLSFLRNLWRNWAGIGWIAFMVGGYLYFPSMLNATSMVHYLGLVGKTQGYAIGIQLIYVGIGASIFLALIQKRMKGVGEIANVVQVFADVLSYLRLYALALAGSIMAETFNGVGTAVGLAIGALVVIAGHCVNILLGTISGVIHGLRLNFIEWYHYSFEGGGRLFKPLMKHKLE